MYYRSSGITPRQPVYNSAAARRLTFDQSQSNSTSFYSRRTLPARNDVYVPESPVHESVWRPGQSLPLPVSYPQPQTFEQPDRSVNDPHAMSHLHSMLQSMQSCIENNFQDVKGRLNELEGRMASIEDKHQQLELHHTTPTSSSESSSSSEKGRKRRSPPELQVSIMVPAGVLSNDKLIMITTILARDQKGAFIIT